jgi:hypothetical protein
MPIYRFAIHHGPAETEKLGIMTLRDDAEAFAFAKLIIRDMPDEDRTCSDGCSLDITDGARAVGRISCDADLVPKAAMGSRTETPGTGPSPSS